MHEGDITPVADIAVWGLAVMGKNLILNMNDHGYKVVAYNRTKQKITDFIHDEAAGTETIGAQSIEEMVGLLKKPRRIMLMVKAGEAVDDAIAQIVPLIEAGDIIIDGGNSNFEDTARRVAEVESKGFLYIGTGVSGGEEGARNGPSIMPGGSSAAWPYVKDIFQNISAKSPDGAPCCDWVGDGGSGHYVKMVHNGIEYGDMQLIAEAYQLMRDYLKLDADQMSQVYNKWSQGDLDSYLIQITAEILAYKDEDGMALVDNILDTAGQKGTGKWTSISSADLGQPVTLISEALYSRFISALKDQRVEASKNFDRPEVTFGGDVENFTIKLGQALYASKIVSYAQGYMLLKAAATEYDWSLNYGAIAEMWSGGCIIRSRFLSDISSAYKQNPDLSNLLMAPFFTEAIKSNEESWRVIVSSAVLAGIPMPAMGTGLAFYDSYRTASLPANLLQAQRDYFGAHTYERIDKPRGEFFHTNWTGHGGSTSSSTYNA